MLRRLSTQLIATRREAPADTSAASHALLVRAGMLHQAGAGLFVLAPLLVRVTRRIEAIIREELTGAGCQEVRFTHLQPSGPWRASGRWDELTRTDPIMLRTRDGSGAELGLAPTHEEQAALFAAERLSSHRQLPQTFYQVTTTFRDEPRPGSGLLRAREFTTADAYSFDLDEAAAAATHERLAAACEAICARCGLDVLRADTGVPGAPRSAAFLAPAAVGGDLVAVSDAGSYRATTEVARAALAPPEAPGPAPMAQIPTPGATTMETLAPFVPDVPPERMVKTLLYAVLTEEGSEIVAALCRGDRSVDERKLARALGAREVGMADATTIRAVTGAEPGYAGPVGLPPDVRVLGDHAVADVQGFVCGANADDAHLRDVWWERDVAIPDLADLDRVAEGDRAPDGGRITIVRAIEAGHATMSGTRYAEALGVAVAGPDGLEHAVWTGSYRLGIERLAVALVEQHHDDAGIVWPTAVAPHTAVVVTVRPGDETQDRLAAQVAHDLLDAGVDAVWDDRDARAGVKFADAELIGFPWRITVGRDATEGRVELSERASGDREVVVAAAAVRRVAAAAAAARVPALP